MLRNANALVYSDVRRVDHGRLRARGEPPLSDGYAGCASAARALCRSPPYSAVAGPSSDILIVFSKRKADFFEQLDRSAVVGENASDETRQLQIVRGRTATVAAAASKCIAWPAYVLCGSNALADVDGRSSPHRA
jgi:hypothetical protein